MTLGFLMAGVLMLTTLNVDADIAVNWFTVVVALYNGALEPQQGYSYCTGGPPSEDQPTATHLFTTRWVPTTWSTR